MKVKFTATNEYLIMPFGGGEFTAELTQSEYEEFKEIEERYFKLQTMLKQRLVDRDGDNYFEHFMYRKYY